MVPDERDAGSLPAGAPNTYDVLLAALPASLLAGAVAAAVSSVPLAAALAGGGLVATAGVGHALFVDPPA